MHMLCTCHAHAHAHAMHMPCTCHAHAMHMPCTCTCTCTCHMHMPCTCHAHAMHMLCTCYAHAMHITVEAEALVAVQLAAHLVGGEGHRLAAARLHGTLQALHLVGLAVVALVVALAWPCERIRTPAVDEYVLVRRRTCRRRWALGPAPRWRRRGPRTAPKPAPPPLGGASFAHLGWMCQSSRRQHWCRCCRLRQRCHCHLR